MYSRPLTGIQPLAGARHNLYRWATSDRNVANAGLDV